MFTKTIDVTKSLTLSTRPHEYMNCCICSHKNGYISPEARKKANIIEDIAERAKIYSRDVKGMMEKVRVSVDNLEMLIDDEVWPLPKYRELLFF